MENKVTNTTKDFASNLLAGLPGGIEAQEKHGQSEFTRSDLIPVKGSSGEDEPALIALGFALGDPVGGDKLFRYAKLPTRETARSAADRTL